MPAADAAMKLGVNYPAGPFEWLARLGASNVVGDNFWLWRADHGRGAGWTSNPNKNGLIVNGNNVTLQVSLLGSAGTILVDPTIRTLNDVPTRYEFTVGANVIPPAQFNSLRLQFTFTSTAGTPAAERGGVGESLRLAAGRPSTNAAVTRTSPANA